MKMNFRVYNLRSPKTDKEVPGIIVLQFFHPIQNCADNHACKSIYQSILSIHGTKVAVKNFKGELTRVDQSIIFTDNKQMIKLAKQFLPQFCGYELSDLKSKIDSGEVQVSYLNLD